MLCYTFLNCMNVKWRQWKSILNENVYYAGEKFMKTKWNKIIMRKKKTNNKCPFNLSYVNWNFSIIFILLSKLLLLRFSLLLVLLLLIVLIFFLFHRLTYVLYNCDLKEYKYYASNKKKWWYVLFYVTWSDLVTGWQRQHTLITHFSFYLIVFHCMLYLKTHTFYYILHCFLHCSCNSTSSF